jgi:hypothetical protein
LVSFLIYPNLFKIRDFVVIAVVATASMDWTPLQSPFVNKLKIVIVGSISLSHLLFQNSIIPSLHKAAILA